MSFLHDSSLAKIWGEPLGADNKYHIGGNLSIEGSPGVLRRVLAVNRYTLKVVGGTITKTDGTWEIKGIPYQEPKSLLVIVSDFQGKYNAEVVDFVTTVKMDQ